MKANPYNTNKLAYHPGLLKKLRKGEHSALIQVHLMPQNTCNHQCDLCSYRMPDNKNSEVFDTTKHIPLEAMRKLIEDMHTAGVKAVEVTGGGEPLAYPHKYEMFSLMFTAGLDAALVTNGTLLDQELAELLAPNLTWMRVSLDAGTPGIYSAIRHVPQKHFYRAVDAVRKIRAVGNHKEEFRLGVSYVMTNGNELDVYKACEVAKEAGADNIRLSMTFSDTHLDYFEDHSRVLEGLRLAERAKADFTDASFQVINLASERYDNLVAHANDFSHCYATDLICVVEGTGTVYSCCTFTGSSQGVLGNILEHPKGFVGVWDDSQEFRRKLDPRTYCNVPCLYNKRNRNIAEMLADGIPDALPEPPPHINFV